MVCRSLWYRYCTQRRSGHRVTDIFMFVSLAQWQDMFCTVAVTGIVLIKTLNLNFRLLESFGGQYWSLFSYVNREPDDKSLTTLWTSYRSDSWKRKCECQSGTFFFCYEKGGKKKPVVNIFTLGLEWITYLSVWVGIIYNLRIVFFTLWSLY